MAFRVCQRGYEDTVDEAVYELHGFINTSVSKSHLPQCYLRGIIAKTFGTTITAHSSGRNTVALCVAGAIFYYLENKNRKWSKGGARLVV